MLLSNKLFVHHRLILLSFWLSGGKTSDAVDGEKEKDATNGKHRLQKPLESITILNKDVQQGGLEERKPSEENGVAAAAGDALKMAKPATEKGASANGYAGGC